MRKFLRAILKGYKNKESLPPKGSEEMYRTLVERANDGIVIIQDEKLVYVNPRLSDILGYSINELLGSSFTHYIHPEQLSMVIDNYRRRLAGEGVSAVYQTILKHKNGRNVYVELNPGMIQYQGKTSNMVIIRDITARYKAEQALKESEQKYREILDNIEEGYYEVDFQGNFTFFNEALCFNTGYTREELLGQNYRILAKNPREVYNTYNKVFKSGRSEKGFTWTLVKKDGEELFVEVSVSLIRDEEGNIAGFRGLARDVTERKKAEEESTYQRKRFEALFKNSTEAIAFVDQNYRVKDINQRFAELFGYALDDILGKKLDVAIPQKDNGEKDKRIKDCLIKGEAVSFESTCFHKSGNRIEVFLKGIPVMIEGEVKGGYVIFTDITEYKQYEEKLRYLSIHDHLTGVYNRMYFEEEMKRLEGSREYPISIFVTDLDGLKVVNDALGHAVGDKLIKACVRVLNKTVRSNDLLARIGGDEFVMLFPRTSAESAESIKKRIELNIANYRKKHQDIMLYLSIGYATAEHSGQSLWETFRKADHDMFRQKVQQGYILKDKIADSITRAKIMMNKNNL